MIVESPEQEILDLPREGLENWNEQDPQIRDLCETTLFNVKSKIVKRQLYLEPFFKDLDKLKKFIFVILKHFVHAHFLNSNQIEYRPRYTHSNATSPFAEWHIDIG